MSERERVGILGGTFDPIHFGHVDAAEAARRALALDRVVLIPAHDPPHRPNDPCASAFHRFALIALAAADWPALRVSDLELLQPGPSYSSLTLQRLHAQGYRATQLFFIIGADAFADIATWYDYPAILDRAHFAVVARPGTTLAAMRARVPALQDRFVEPGATPSAADGTRLWLVDAMTRDVSSTGIRARLARGESLAGLVPPAVEDHIRRHELYTRGAPGPAGRRSHDPTAGRAHEQNEA